MKNYDQSVQIKHNPNLCYIPHHPYRILIFGGSGSRKTNVLLNLILPRLKEGEGGGLVGGLLGTQRHFFAITSEWFVRSY